MRSPVNHPTVDEIRQAIANEEFLRAKSLWDAYAAQLQQAIENRTATPAMLSETRDLVEWARLRVASFRAHATDQLQSLHVAQAYYGPAPAPNASLHIKG